MRVEKIEIAPATIGCENRDRTRTKVENCKKKVKKSSGETLVQFFRPHKVTEA